MNDKEQLYIFMRALARLNPENLEIRLIFYSYSGGGLRLFAVVCLLFTAYRPKFLCECVVVCGSLQWFAVVWDGLRCFVL